MYAMDYSQWVMETLIFLVPSRGQQPLCVPHALKGISTPGPQDNCNSTNQTTITILILVDELKYWKCDVCNGLQTMGDGSIDLLGTQQTTAAPV
jgi:hypothetical protein